MSQKIEEVFKKVKDNNVSLIQLYNLLYSTLESLN